MCNSCLPQDYLVTPLYWNAAPHAKLQTMQRRTLLKLGATSAVLLAVIGSTAALIQPGLVSSTLTSAGREVFRAISLGVLDKTLPVQAAAKDVALTALLARIDGLIAALPLHTQTELSQLLSILVSGLGRRALAGLDTPWATATATDIQAALQGMRLSSLAVRQQAYAAVHEITASAYFSEPGTWPMLGYPGPLVI